MGVLSSPPRRHVSSRLTNTHLARTPWILVPSREKSFPWCGLGACRWWRGESRDLKTFCATEVRPCPLVFVFYSNFAVIVMLLCMHGHHHQVSKILIFSVRPNGASSPTPYSWSSNCLGESTLSLNLEGTFCVGSQSMTVAPVGPTTLLHISTSINLARFPMNSNISTQAKGSARPSNFSLILRNYASIPKRSSRTQKPYESTNCEGIWFLCEDRGFYSDVPIALIGNFGGNNERTTAICSSRRFIFVSRSSYFHTVFISCPSPKNAVTDASEPPMLSLPLSL